MAGSNWTIVGNDPFADMLRSATTYVPATAPMTIATEPGNVPSDAFLLGRAALESDSGRVVPFYAAFEAVEAVSHELIEGLVGRIYGCYASLRLPRGASGDELVFQALIPSVALVLDLLPGRPERIWAKRASLMSEDDAWFVIIRFDDEVIATIEAMATTDGTPERELLVELTGADQVLRAEPMRQSVVVERLESAHVTAPWWEDVGERYLQLLTRRMSEEDRGSAARLRNVWNAINEAGGSEQPVTL